MPGSHASVRPVRGGFWKEVSVLEIGVAAGLLLLFFLSDTFVETIAGIYILIAAMLFAAAVQARMAAACSAPFDRRLWLAGATACLVEAIILFVDPLLGGQATSLTIAAALGAGAAGRLALALVRQHPGRGWLYVSGAVGMAVAMAIGFGWPFASIIPAAQTLTLDLLAVATMLASVTGKLRTTRAA